MSVHSVSIGSSSLLSIDPDSEVYVPVALADLRQTAHLFVKKTDGQEIDVQGENGFVNFYDVMDSHGVRIFRAVERTPKELKRKRGQVHFLVVILDSTGTEIIDYKGIIGENYVATQGGVGWGGVSKRIHFDHRDIFPVYFTKQSVSTNKNPTGTINTNHLILKNKDERPTEALKTKRSVDVLFIVSDKYDNNIGCCGCKILVPEERLRKINRDMEANVYLPDRSTMVGRVGTSWDSTDSLRCDPIEVTGCMGIECPLRTDLRIKAILLGAVFMLFLVGFIFYLGTVLNLNHQANTIMGELESIQVNNELAKDSDEENKAVNSIITTGKRQMSNPLEVFGSVNSFNFFKPDPEIHDSRILFELHDENGNPLYFAVRKSPSKFQSRCDISLITFNGGVTALRLINPKNSPHKIKVLVRNEVLGSVLKTNCSFCPPKFTLRDRNRKEIALFRTARTCCIAFPNLCCGITFGPFKIIKRRDHEGKKLPKRITLASISRDITASNKAIYSRAIMELQFQTEDLDITTKCLIIATTIFLDFTIYDESSGHSHCKILLSIICVLLVLLIIAVVVSLQFILK